MSSLAEPDSSLGADADITPESLDETTFLISHNQPVTLPPQDVERRFFGLPKKLWWVAPAWLLGYILLNRRRETQIQRRTYTGSFSCMKTLS
jgi:hypothetical protein